jgi:predicted PurR-regulated permease PerM
VKVRTDIVDFVDAFSEAMSRYFRGQVVVAMSMAALFSIGFTVLGLRMAILLGLFIGVLNMVPYLQAIGFVPAIILGLIKSLETSETLWWTVGGVLVVFAVCQLLQDLVIVPKIMGRTTGLSPVAILLGVFIWGKLLGFLGLILAIPFTCMGTAYYRRFVLGHHVDHLSGMPPENAVAPGDENGHDD